MASAIQQDYPNLEILLVDDVSTDDTVQIAQDILGGHPAARIVVNDSNQGLVGNWNRCLELAKGEFVKFLFQDDLLTPECVSKMVAAGRSSRLVACHRSIAAESTVSKGIKSFFEGHTSRMQQVWPIRRELDPAQFAEIALQNLDYNLYGEPSAILLHRSHWETQGMFDAQFKHLCDLEMTYRVVARFGYIHLAETLCTFRIHGSSTTSENVERKTTETAVDHVKLIDKIETDPIFETFRASARNRIELERNALRIHRWFATLDTPTESISEASRKRVELLRKLPLAGKLLGLCIRLRGRLSRLRKS